MTTASINPQPRSLRRRASRSIVADRVATALLWATGIFVLALLGAIILHFALSAVGTVTPDFLLGYPDITGLTTGGIFPVFWNSIYMLVLTMFLAVPIGILGGIYMAEYSVDTGILGTITGLIRFAQEAVSSVPSIVVGLFGLILFVDTFHWGYTALGGALALTLFNLPLMTRLSEQALRAVPRDERSASLALGATKWQTVRHVIVPLAIPGLVTGVILTAGRVFGEAAVLLFTSGMSVTPFHYNFANLNITDPNSPWSPFRPGATMSVYIWAQNSEGLGQHVKDIANGSAAILIAMVLIFNLGARGLGRLLTRRLTAS